MRLITKLVPIIFLGLMMLGLSTPVSAQSNPWGDFQFPDVKPPQPQVGQSASYAISIAGIPDQPGPISANLRIAFVGKETIEGKLFYWFELDIGNISGLPPPVAGFVSSFKLKMLIKDMPHDAYKDDPKAALQDFAKGNVMRKLVFQLNDDVPQVIDFMALQGLATTFGGGDLESLVEDIPFDEMEDDQENPMTDIKFDCGKENVSVAGKAYSNAAYCTFEGKAGEENVTVKGKTYMHESIPIGAFLKMALDVHNATENETVKISMELTGYKSSGAASQIVGEPVPFDFASFMGGMMGGGMMGGGMPPMGGME